MKRPPITGEIPDEPPAVTEEEACESIIGKKIMGLGLDDDHVSILLDDGRTVVFENCDRLWIEVRPRMH